MLDCGNAVWRIHRGKCVLNRSTSLDHPHLNKHLHLRHIPFLASLLKPMQHCHKGLSSDSSEICVSVVERIALSKIVL
jgi:hypothetical protein